MGITRLQDVIQPEVFSAYVVRATMEKSALYQSGIVTNSPDLDARASGPNSLVHMPYFEDLVGESQNVKDEGYIVPKKIGTNKDVAKKIVRADGWGANGLSALLSGADPMDAIASRVADYWTRDMQRVLMATLKGVFAAPTMAEKLLDISGNTGDASKINASTFVDANQLMGDAKELLTAFVAHSAVEAYLAKLQLIEYEETQNKSQRIPTFMGKRLIVDDSMPFDTSTGVATAYLFGEGAIAMGNGSHPRIIETEVDRDRASLSGEDYLYNRKIYILHPRGVKWTEAAIADEFPENTELSNAANWERVYEPKAVRMVAFTFKVG